MNYCNTGKGDDDYVRKIQEIFALFIEIGHPERTYSTPAHLGVYVLDEGVSFEKKRELCKFWDRWKDLAKRY